MCVRTLVYVYTDVRVYMCVPVCMCIWFVCLCVCISTGRTGDPFKSNVPDELRDCVPVADVAPPLKSYTRNYLSRPQTSRALYVTFNNSTVSCCLIISTYPAPVIRSHFLIPSASVSFSSL